MNRFEVEVNFVCIHLGCDTLNPVYCRSIKLKMKLVVHQFGLVADK